MAGLPSDSFSITSAAIMHAADRPPLFIDPQSTATRWLKRQERDNGLRLVRLADGTGAMRTLESALGRGQPVLCDGLT